jgi:hypothetical protein
MFTSSKAPARLTLFHVLRWALGNGVRTPEIGYWRTPRRKTRPAARRLRTAASAISR